MTLATTITCLGGIPSPGIIANAVNALLEPLIPDELVVTDGPQLTPAEYQGQIAELVISRPQFSAHGKRKAELVMQWMDVIGVDLSRTGFIATYSDTDVASSGPFVDALAKRIASFPREALELAKQSVNASELPLADGLVEEGYLFQRSFRTESAQRNMRRFLELGGQTQAGEQEMGALCKRLGETAGGPDLA